MKKTFKQFGLAVVVAAIALFALSLTGCGGNDDTKTTGDETGNPPVGGNPTPETFTLTFETNGGSPTPPNQTIEKGKTATEPQGVTKANNILDGWYKESTLSTKWNFVSDNVTANITLYAKWTSETFTVMLTSIVDMAEWLDNQKDNTAATAYNVKLNVNNLGGSSGTAGSAGYVLKINNKYVNLDLSGSSITSIGDSAFSECTTLTGITIPKSITSIESSAFYGCTGLTSITIPNSVTSIGERVFSGCTGLTSVNIPYSVTSIGYYAFNGCDGLTSIKIPNSVTTIGNGAFFGCTSLTGITIPYSVTGIGDYAFGGCTGLTSVTIPNSVTYIGYYAFGGCDGLTSITIPKSVTGIRNEAFEFCTNLTSVTFLGTIKSSGLSFGDGAFLGDLRAKFYATDATNGTPGTYTTTAPVSYSSVWTKQP